MTGGGRAKVALVCLAMGFWLGLALAPAGAADDGAWQTQTTSEPQITVVPKGPASDNVSDKASDILAAEPAGPAESAGIETGAVAERAPPVSAIADKAVLAHGEGQTTFSINLSRGVTAEVFTLPNPYRVVVDLPDVTFNLPPEAGSKGAGHIKAYRYGLFAEGKARIVLDATGPVRIEKAEMSAPAGGGPLRLEIKIAATSPETFGDGTGARRPPPQKSAAAERENGAVQPRKGTKPVIVIDPGHGGIDPGAIGSSHLPEKTVVLAVGLEIRKLLLASGRYDVRMTRASDVFVSLDQRLNSARQNGADLFISLHADSIEQKALAQNVRGATVYTLSERASDEQARLMAVKENASDLLAGIHAEDDTGNDQVKNILIDLMKRETSNFSTAFSNMLVRSLRQSISMSRDPQRAAAFKVLKQTQSPAVLVELGYMSHSEDERLLNSAQWQERVAQSVTRAVHTFFVRQTAGAARNE